MPKSIGNQHEYGSIYNSDYKCIECYDVAKLAGKCFVVKNIRIQKPGGSRFLDSYIINPHLLITLVATESLWISDNVGDERNLVFVECDTHSQSIVGTQVVSSSKIALDTSKDLDMLKQISPFLRGNKLCN